MEYIVHHPVYEGIPFKRNKDGLIVWVAPKSSDLGKKRLEWWSARQLPNESLRDTAYRLHPTKRKPCHVCGREMELDYVYPSLNRLKHIAKLLERRDALTPALKDFLSQRETGLMHVRDVAHRLAELGGQEALEAFAEAFSIPKTVQRTPSDLVEHLLGLGVEERRFKLSPGAMSNAPDRLDGFHSYNLCCRPEKDRGRRPENLSKYGEDRRAYEFWVDGDHKAASWVMKQIGKLGWSADHIGPVSQGFTHRPNGFRPVTKQFQSTRRDRLRAVDICLLLKAEGEGEVVASWHVRVLWDRLKRCALCCDERAEALGRALRAQVHDTLTLLSHLLERGYEEFLRYLRRELFRNQLVRIEAIEFPGLDVDEVEQELRTRGEYHSALRAHLERSRLPLRTENKRSAYRVLRKSIESLRNYASSTLDVVGSNRKVNTLSSEEVARLLEPVLAVLELHDLERNKRFEQAEKELFKVVDSLANQKAEELRRKWGCDLTQTG